MSSGSAGSTEDSAKGVPCPDLTPLSQRFPELHFHKATNVSNASLNGALQINVERFFGDSLQSQLKHAAVNY